MFGLLFRVFAQDRFVDIVYAFCLVGGGRCLELDLLQY